MPEKYYFDDECGVDGEQFDSQDEEDESSSLSPEDWQDWNSEELLDLWMSVVEYHEQWYIPLRRTFNQFCEFIYRGDEDFTSSGPVPREIQAIENHPLVKGLNWTYFFSLGYK